MLPQLGGRRIMRTLRVLTAATCLVSLASITAPPAAARHAAPAAAAAIKAVPVKTGLNGPSGFTFGPSGTIWYLERGTGEVRTLNRRTGATHLFFTISRVDGSGERGALGIALDPAFPTKPFVYVYVTRTWHGHVRNQLVRIRKDGSTGSRMKILLTMQGNASSYHNGGRILFGPDEKLYVVVGDAHDSGNSQDLTSNLRGKILRLNRDGSGAAGNPHGRIWSFGHRNSFGFTFDPKTGRLWETENGPSCNDEINLIVKGGNFGWGPHQNCTGTAPRDTNNSGPRPRRLPKIYFAGPIGITGAAFCISCRLGSGIAGDLVFGDVNSSSIRAMNMNAGRTGPSGGTRILLATGTGGVHSLEVGPKHRIYFSGPNGIYRLARA
jgi:aldose sugar dehydrogenase